jgi:hypothetical protein
MSSSNLQTLSSRLREFDERAASPPRRPLFRPSSEVPLRKGAIGACLQVVFETSRRIVIVKLDRDQQLPRSMTRRVSVEAGIGSLAETWPRRRRGLDEARAEGASEVWRGGRDSNLIHRA